MADDKNKALLMVLGRPKAPGAAPGGAGAAEPDGDESGDGYDADLDTAIADFASALGVSVQDPEKAREAYKTMHDICSRASGEG